MRTDPSYPAFPIASFIGFILVLVPLPWQFQAWNSGTCFYMLWTSIACLNQFINSIVWANNAINFAPVWCDISTRIVIGASVGIPASSLCITRRLYKISRLQAVVVTRAEKGRMVLIDSLLCVLLPIIYITLEYIVQGHRFNIFENLGCYPAIYNTLPAYFLVYMWPVAIGLVSSIYCGLALRALLQRQAQFREFLSNGSSLTISRYLRLMALAMTEILFTIPLGVYELYSNAIGGALQPWKGWDDTHFNFSHVGQYVAAVWRADPTLRIPLELSRWIVVVCAFVFFGFFGLTEDARRQYRLAFASFSKRFAFFRVAFTTRLADRATLASSKPSLPETLPPYSARSMPSAIRSSLSSTAYTGEEKVDFKRTEAEKSTADSTELFEPPFTPSSICTSNFSFTDLSHTPTSIVFSHAQP